MPMDENTKNELIKRIQEQQKAILKGKPLSGQPSSKTQPSPDSVHQESKNNFDIPDNVNTLKLSDLISDDQSFNENEVESSDWMNAEKNELSWTKAIFIVSILIGAILFGIFLGYLATILESIKKM